jgi:hypothetical protein
VDVSEGREGHVLAVQLACNQVQRLQTATELVRERYPDLLEMTVSATGEQPATDASRAALEAVVLVNLRISELADVLAIAKARLREYGQTF